MVSVEELAQHRARDDAWIAVDGVVYDITPHVRNHPGWTFGSVTTVVAIMAFVGKDATRAWHEVDVHRSKKAVAELRSYRIGTLEGHESEATTPPDRDGSRDARGAGGKRRRGSADPGRMAALRRTSVVQWVLPLVLRACTVAIAAGASMRLR